MKTKFTHFLSELQQKCVYNTNENDFEIGYRCATQCINETIETRKNIFIEDVEDVNNSEECKLYIEDCINNILWVITETLDNKNDNNDFNKGYEKKVAEFVKAIENYKKDT